ncbi:S9 family peptidase [Rhodoferax sp. AJA081-3]|uniref:alpha/beta hydrolase family protein n=1 Tax=Rhodoferax sp. AJA081-3 TaxID=2752316 RepID=UPI001AE0CDB3|nr:S9 family peptidase [Rhodoferax sp. AJA081-3]QTN29458.1 S9 family peptidase [Rhodoferax sp. AJA081-3]
MPASKHPITIADLWSLKRLGTGSLSPDGQWTCATVTSYDMKKNESSTQLWLLSTDGKTQRQLTRGKRDGDPQWSPDGKWIAFVSKRGEGKDADAAGQIYLIAPDGGEARRVAQLATGVSALRWFPDSKRLAFVSWVWPELTTQAAQEKKFKEDKDDKVQATVVEHNHYRYWDHWFARGRKPHIHVVDIPSKGGNGKIRDLFAGTAFHLPQQEPDAALFDISPDGKELAFTFDANPDPRDFSFTDIVAMDVKTGKTTTLTTRDKALAQFAFEGPRYSPDGKYLAFVGCDFTHQHNEQNRAWLLERKTKKPIPWSTTWDRGVNGPLHWAAASDAVYFTAEHGVAQPIWRLAVDAKVPTEVLRGPGEGGTAGDLRISANGKTLVYARSSMLHPPTLLACNADGSGERAIEKFNSKLMAGLQMGDARSVEVAGFDGDTVQMWIVSPPGYTANTKKKWPLMQVIHGGPHTCWSDTWHWRWNMQMFAASGYVTCAVNYHGSSGFGQKFLSSINGDWGRREMADVEAGTDYMLATSTIDAKRMVATGGSYGGYMVAYMNGNLPAKRYQAYVCHAGCYDWVSMMGSDGYFWFGHELGAFHWDDEARVMKQSPHHYAQNFNTPTLVMHGELDYRVPYYQGLAYYNTLRARGIPSRLVFFPDENHWILKPQNSKLWYAEFTGWCDRYTKGKGSSKLVK